jgi:hypothetical protein
MPGVVADVEQRAERRVGGRSVEEVPEVRGRERRVEARVDLRRDVGVAVLQGEPVVRQGQEPLEPGRGAGRRVVTERADRRGDRRVYREDRRGAVDRLELRRERTVRRRELGERVGRQDPRLDRGRRDRRDDGKPLLVGAGHVDDRSLLGAVPGRREGVDAAGDARERQRGGDLVVPVRDGDLVDRGGGGSGSPEPCPHLVGRAERVAARHGDLIVVTRDGEAGVHGSPGRDAAIGERHLDGSGGLLLAAGGDGRVRERDKRHRGDQCADDAAGAPRRREGNRRIHRQDAAEAA